MPFQAAGKVTEFTLEPMIIPDRADYEKQVVAQPLHLPSGKSAAVVETHEVDELGDSKTSGTY